MGSAGDQLRGLARGLEVLRIIHGEARPQSLHDLHLKSGISEPSLLRILATLEVHHMVRRGIDDHRYRRGISLDEIRSASARNERLIAAAAPVLDRLCARVKWPTDLAVRAGDSIKLCESTRSLSPFRLDRAPIGRRISMAFSGAGRAYLAFAPASETAKILGRLEDADEELVRTFVRSGRMQAVLDDVRRLGYGERDRALTRLPGLNGGSIDGTWGISVPLRGRRRVHGCINLIWVHRACSTSTIVDRHLGHLKAAAAEIVAAVEATDLPRH